MRNFDEPLDVKQFTSDLVSLTPSEIEEVLKEMENHHMFTPTGAEKSEGITPGILSAWSIIGATRCDDKTQAAVSMKVAKWFKEYDKLLEQHEEDDQWRELTLAEIKFWEEFWKYITDRAIGDRMKIIDAVNDTDHRWFEGYVKVKKSINAKQEILMTFETEKGERYVAEWQSSDNYAVWQTCGFLGDDYSGYMLFPTDKEDEYFCIYYNC